MKVLNYGSLNIDYVYSVPHFIAPGETMSAEKLLVNAGGKGANQAASLAKAGLEVFMAGKLGHDGEFILKLLRSYGADTSNVTVTDEPSGHAIIQVDRNAQNGIILYGGGNKSIKENEIQDVFSKFGPGDWLVIQNEINNLDAIIRTAKKKGMKICFNIAPFDDAALSLPLDLVDIIVVNEIEGAGLAGTKCCNFEKMMDELERKYPHSSILLTVGKAGAYWISDGKRIHHPIIDYPVVDTTAAGDTFIGYFLASRIYGNDIRKALYHASKASGIAVSRSGAMQSIPDRKEVFEEE